MLVLVAALMAGGALRQRRHGAPPVRRSLTVGLWVASVGWRINRMLPLGNFIFNVFSPMGRYATGVVSLGLSQLYLVMIAFAVLMMVATLLLVLFAEWIRRRGQPGKAR